MSDETPAIVRLFLETPRQGPGDPVVLDRMIAALGPGPSPEVADLGCGTGATARRLAERLGADVIAIDAAGPFIEELQRRLEERPAAPGRIEARVGDMIAPGIPEASLDLIISEGAVYNVGFEAAMKAWLPLVRPGGGLVVSECVWTGEKRPQEVIDWLGGEHPTMANSGEVLQRAERAGWRFVAAERLPLAAWFESYYDVLRGHMKHLEHRAAQDEALMQEIAGMRAEMEIVARNGEHFAYVYFALERPR